jgi:selenocysteine-specific elongation factor
MRVIGTAGHVDHGKSTLVQALTGTHPDRLKEEQEREMTIDLGFAWLTLPDGEEVGIVDVPGHRDFIENMLAGVGGIDAALFVVAADEGVMPQTREHLAILDLLQIPAGVIALTKTDLVDEPGWLDLVEVDVRQALVGTVLQDAPLVRISARRGEGIPALKQAIQECLAGRPRRADLGRARLPVDRVFTMPGFGTVTTGTLMDGYLTVGDEVEILPAGKRGRVRGLQSHKRKTETAAPGSRTAVNLGGVDLQEVQRGDVVARPGAYKPTRRLDVQFRLLRDASQPLRHSTEAKFFLGAAEVLCRVRLLGAETLEPGQSGWLQLELRDPVVGMRGDHYILRRPSPGETLGGGIIVDAQPKGRHKRFNQAVLERLETLRQGDPQEVLLQALAAGGPAPAREALARSGLKAETARQALTALLESGQALVLEDSAGPLTAASDALVASREDAARRLDAVLAEVASYHRFTPLRPGMGREELKSRLKAAPRLFNALLRRLAQEGRLEESGPLVRLPGFQIRFSAEQQRQVERLLRQFEQAPYSPPSVKECQAEIGEDLLAALLDSRQLVQVSPEVVFRPGDYQAMLERVTQILRKDGTITVAQVRDLFNTSRRYVLALLEHLDSLGVTMRDGDYRRLRPAKPGSQPIS